MKSRIANRALWIAVIALVLGALLAVSSFAAGEGLSVGLAGTVNGLEADKEYTIQSYDVLTGEKGTAKALTASTVVEAGVWYVSDGENGSYVFQAGAQSGQITYWDTTANKPVGNFASETDTIVPGKWSRSSDGAYTVITYYYAQSAGVATGNDQSVCLHFSKPKFLKMAEGATTFEGSTPITGADNKLQESVIYYGFTAEQVVPAAQVKDLTIKAATLITGACELNAGKTTDDMKGIFTFIVKDPATGATENYTVNTVGEQKSFTAPVAMAESAGYLVGFSYAPFANSADDLLVCKPSDYASSTGYAHIGLAAGENKINFASDFAAPTGLAVVDGKVTGLVEGSYYQYATLTLGENAVLVEGTPAKLDANTKPEGLFKVRQTNAEGTVFTAWSDMLYARGSSIHNILHTVQKNDKNGKALNIPVMKTLPGPTPENVLVDHFTPGTWMGFVISDSLQIDYGFNQYRLGGTSCYLYTECNNYTKATDEAVKTDLSNKITAVLGNVYFSYGYENDEIIPMEDWVSYKFQTYIRQTGAKVGTGAIKTKVVLYVVNDEGQVEQRTALYDNTYSGSKTITASQSDFADNSGYVVGIKIVPYFAPEGTKYIGTGAVATDLNIQLMDEAYKINLPKQPKPTGLYVENGVIKGLDATKEYAYAGMSVNGPTTSTKVAAGATEITGLTGLVGVMTYGNGYAILNSDPVIFYIEGNADDRATLGTITGNVPAYKTSTEWIAGTWTGSYLSWIAAEQVAAQYNFLDQTSGVNSTQSQTLWLYSRTKEEAQAKLNADAATAPPASWAKNNVTSKPSRLQAIIDTHYAAADYEATLPAKLAALQTEIATGLESRYIQYAYDQTEAIPVSELVEMSFTYRSRQTDFVFDATPKAIFYVMDANGAITEHAALGLKHEVKLGQRYKMTADVQSIEGIPAEGWVVAVKFYPHAEVDDATIAWAKETYRVDASNQAFSFTQHHIDIGYYYTPYTDYVIKAKAPVPTFEVAANEEGLGYDVTITNASDVGNYEYKSATGAWTAVKNGKFTVAETGTYTVRVSGELFVGTAQASIEVKKLTPTAPTLDYGINSGNDFVVTITNPSSLYTYEYKAEADTEWTAVEGNSFLAVVGKYQVRATGAVWDGYATAEITTAKVAPVAPKVSVVPGTGADFTVNIKNFSDLYVYEYKLNDAADWTAVEAGAKSFVITVGGEYTIRAGGVVYDGYATTGFKAVEVPQEIKALVIDSKTGVLTGLDASKAYEYAKVNYLGISDTWTAIPAGTEFTFENAGLYAVRLAATGTEDASTAMVFNKLGTIAERGTIYNTYTKSYPSGTYNKPDNKQMEVIKWQSFSSFDAIEFVPGSWTAAKIGDLAYWNTSWGMHVGATTCYMTYGPWGEALTNGTKSLADYIAQLNAYKFRYAYEDTEIIPLADLEKMTFTAGTRQGHINQTAGKAYANVIFYISTPYGEIEERKLVLPASLAMSSSWGPAHTSYSISAADFEDTDGYIVAIDIIPFAELTEDTELVVGSVHADQDVSVIFNDYQVKLPRVASPDYLTYNEKTKLVEGLDPDVEYFYAPYSINGAGVTKYVVGEETIELAVGLWSFGVVSTDPEYADSLPYFVFVRGDEDARAELGERKPDGYYVTSRDNVFKQGVWSGTTTDPHSTFGFDGISTLGGHVGGSLAKALKAAIDAEDAAAEAAARAQVVAAADIVAFKYGFTNEEIIPADELLNFKFKQMARMGSINLGAGTTAKVTFYVVNPLGDIEAYTWEEETSTTTNATEHDVDVYELLKGVEGYVVAVEINPWTKVNPDNVVVKDANNYNTMSQVNFMGYSIKLAPEAPVVETLEAPNATGLGEIANLSPAMTYEYRTYDAETGTYGEWVVVPAGSTSVRLPAGDYQIRVAESRNFTESEPVDVTILKSDVERVSLMNETKKIHLPNDFIEVTANYEIDVTNKVWIARLALDNIKAVAPDSTVTISGDGFKYVVLASDLATDKVVHYYNLDLSFNGESKFDKNYDEIAELAGDAYIVEFFSESTYDLPFEAAELYIEVGTKYDGQEVELRAYNERIGKLRKTETGTVENGWVMFTSYGDTYVVMTAEE